MKPISDYAAEIDAALAEALDADFCAPPLLREAMLYALGSGGKRLRPAMLLAAVDMLGGEPSEALASACALELIHTYSLVHDDLPCMDDDDTRRGRPSCHIAFGEGQAVIAGDSLLTLAFELMARDALRFGGDMAGRVAAMAEIASSAGAGGMAGGQSLDMLEGAGGADFGRVAYLKTARLFEAAARAAGLICGAGEEAARSLGEYGAKFGTLFQIADDISDEAEDGAADPDGARAGAKLTAVSERGLDGAVALARECHSGARAALSPFGRRARPLADLADGVLARAEADYAARRGARR